MDTREPIYLDYNATTPIAPEVAAAMRPCLERLFGNPSSSHPFGLAARQAVETARRQVAGLCGCFPDEVVFTSGGSEANNMAIKGTAWALRDRGRHIVTSAIEHPAVTEVCRYLEGEGFSVTYLSVDGEGRVDPAAVERALRPDTILVTIMLANNEVGTIEPLADIARITRARGVRLHSDGAQAAGKIPARMDDLGVDLFSIAGHKLYAPKGVGALIQRRGVALAKLIHGADHEADRRAGTENVLEIVGLGAAAELTMRDLEVAAGRQQALRDRLHRALVARAPDLHLNGPQEGRLPNTLSVSFPGLEATTILAELDHVAASAGAACHADQVDVSHVLQAMGVPVHIAMGTLRLTVGRYTTEAEVDRAAAEIGDVIDRLRGERGQTTAGEETESGAVRLTRYTHGLGCACKIQPQLLEQILSELPRSTDPNLLIGTDTSDDAAVYRIGPDQALVATLDFFTPIVDDPRAFGAIAAANALSDVYAKGARPLLALNIVGFPARRLPLAVLRDILAGAADVAAAAGIPIAGGHSVDDTEPKFGWAVVGLVHPDRVLANSTARVGDDLVLTKPIGTGILATAAKRGAASPAAVAQAVATMAALNRGAAEAMVGLPVSACTDVTGFGLLGHLREMTAGSGVEAEVWADRVPILPEAADLAGAGIVPGGTHENLAHVAPHVVWDEAIPPIQRLLLADAQTSGGLLISIPADHRETLQTRLDQAGTLAAAWIGHVTGPGAGRLRVRAGTGGA